MIIDIARTTRDRLRDGHRSMVFHRAMRRLLRDPAGVAAETGTVLSDLVYGWGNESWSAEPEFLRSCIERSLTTQAPILECGSGVSTIVLGAIAQHTGNTVCSLEHLPEWGERARLCLDEFKIDAVRLCVGPLVRYGHCDWYAPPFGSMPDRFGLVVCDGPPADTFGGRYGLVPVMKKWLKPGCVILLDDAEREAEQDIIQRWAHELPCTFSRVGQTKPFFAALVEDQIASTRSQFDRPVTI